jgi:hypothetical protein
MPEPHDMQSPSPPPASSSPPSPPANSSRLRNGVLSARHGILTPGQELAKKYRTEIAASASSCVSTFIAVCFFPIPIELVVRGGPLTDKLIAVPTRLGKDADASVSSIYRPPWRNAIALPTNSPPQPVADIAHGPAAGTNSGAFGTVSRRRNRPKECEDSGGVCVIIIMLAFSARFYVDIFSRELRC